MKKLNLFFLLFLLPLMVFGQTNNTVYGSGALDANTTGSYNSAFGYRALFDNTTGSYNSAFGVRPLYTNQTGSRNSAFGYYALYSSTGNDNTAFGYYSLYFNQGRSNSAVGSKALYYNTSGTDNTAFGFEALTNNGSGPRNTAIGAEALTSQSVGSDNTAVGYNSLSQNTTGSYNSGFGTKSLQYGGTGSYNTGVGYLAGPQTDGFSNTTAIGYLAMPTASNQVRIGNSAVASIGGWKAWSNISDGRVKKNIRAEVPGLAFINLLQPVTYNLDMDAIDELQKSNDPEFNSHRETFLKRLSPDQLKELEESRANRGKQVHSGFIAQDVEKAAKSINYNFSGIDAPENEKSTYALRYAEFVVPLVKAVQELNTQLIEQNNKLQNQINELTVKMDELTKSQSAGAFQISEPVKDFSISLFPNPTNGIVTVNYSLYADTSISIEIYSIMGQKLKTILSNQYKTTGDYSVQASVSDLNTGTYIVKGTSKSQIESLQLVVKK